MRWGQKVVTQLGCVLRAQCDLNGIVSHDAWGRLLAFGYGVEARVCCHGEGFRLTSRVKFSHDSLNLLGRGKAERTLIQFRKQLSK